MKEEKGNIFTVFDELISRDEKEKFLKQKARVIWFTGLSGSGKTTIAKGLERKLHETGHLTKMLDGDNIRAGINNNLGFSEVDRLENVRRIAEVSKLFVDGGIVVIACFVSPTEAIRNVARDIIGEKDFILVHVDTPLEECEKRDVKGLYKKARRGEIPDFTGISSPYERPVDAQITLSTEGKTIEDSVNEMLTAVKEYILLPSN